MFSCRPQRFISLFRSAVFLNVCVDFNCTLDQGLTRGVFAKFCHCSDRGALPVGEIFDWPVALHSCSFLCSWHSADIDWNGWECPLSGSKGAFGHGRGAPGARLLCPRKQTSRAFPPMSAECQERTLPMRIPGGAARPIKLCCRGGKPRSSIAAGTSISAPLQTMQASHVGHERNPRTSSRGDH